MQNDLSPFSLKMSRKADHAHFTNQNRAYVYAGKIVSEIESDSGFK